MNHAERPELICRDYKVTRHRVWQFDPEHPQHHDIAGPFVEAGGINAGIANLPNYKAGLGISECHRFWLVLQGRMSIRLADRSFVAEPGDLICMPEGIPVERAGLGAISIIYVQIEDTPFWAPLKTLERPVRKYEHAKLLHLLMLKLTMTDQIQDTYSARCAREHAEMLTTIMKREIHQSADDLSGSIKRLHHLLASIRANPDYKWDRAAMAKEVNMSERNLSRVCQRVFKMPPAKLLRTLRLEVAARMLVDSNMTLGAIANAVGYDSASSFSHLFTKLKGISPGNYRKLPVERRKNMLSEEKANEISH